MRICRMASAAARKKWLRSFHWCCREPASLSQASWTRAVGWSVWPESAWAILRAANLRSSSYTSGSSSSAAFGSPRSMAPRMLVTSLIWGCYGKRLQCGSQETMAVAGFQPSKVVPKLDSDSILLIHSLAVGFDLESLGEIGVNLRLREANDFRHEFDEGQAGLLHQVFNCPSAELRLCRFGAQRLLRLKLPSFSRIYGLHVTTRAMVSP